MNMFATATALDQNIILIGCMMSINVMVNVKPCDYKRMMCISAFLFLVLEFNRDLLIAFIFIIVQLQVSDYLICVIIFFQSAIS